MLILCIRRGGGVSHMFLLFDWAETWQESLSVLVKMNWGGGGVLVGIPVFQNNVRPSYGI